MTTATAPATIPTQAAAYIGAVRAYAEAIRELQEVSEGDLYAATMNTVPLCHFERVISALISTGLVERTPARVLRWKGEA